MVSECVNTVNGQRKSILISACFREVFKILQNGSHVQAVEFAITNHSFFIKLAHIKIDNETWMSSISKGDYIAHIS